MAKYHKNLKYHEDEVKKHSITEDEIRFLLDLQKEMNTQDTVSQADPRFWVIKGTEKEFGYDDGCEDGCLLLNEEGKTVAKDMKSAKEYIEEKKKKLKRRRIS